jgi:hypothetical protein
MRNGDKVEEGQLRAWKRHIGLDEPEYFLVVRVYTMTGDVDILFADLLSSTGIKSIPVSIFRDHSKVID